MYLSVDIHLKDQDKVEARKVDGSFAQTADYYTLSLTTNDSSVVVFMSPENAKRIVDRLNGLVWAKETV